MKVEIFCARDIGRFCDKYVQSIEILVQISKGDFLKSEE